MFDRGMNNPPFRQAVCEPALGLAIVFCLGLRFAFHRLYGLSYDSSVIWWQMLDTELLRHQPLQSLYLLHMQPPLLNAVYAVALAMPDGLLTPFLQTLFVGSSLAMVAIVYVFLRRLGFRSIGAGLAAALFGVLPQVLLYENIYFYSHLEATLVLCAALFAALYFENGRLGAFAGLAISVAALGLLRSLFHLGWVTVVLLAVWTLAGQRHGRNWRALALSVAAIAVVASVYVKNWMEFGIFAASSWEGVTLVNMLTPSLPGDNQKFPDVAQDLQKRAGRGEFSRSMIPALQTPDVWHGWIVLAKDCDTGTEKRPALCEIERANGEFNFNHIAMLAYSRDLGRDALHLLRLYPRLYLSHVASSVMTFVGTPAWDYRRMALALKDYTNLWNEMLLYRPGRLLEGKSGRRTWWDSAVNRLASSSPILMFFVLFGSATIFICGAFDAWGYWRGRRATADWLFPALVLALFVVVPNLLNGVETQRIRYSVEPLLFVALFGGALSLRRRDR